MVGYEFPFLLMMAGGIGLICTYLSNIEKAILNKREHEDLKIHINRISEIIIEFEATESNVYDTNKVAETIGKISAHIKRD